jgi:hypothetical protein
MQAFDDCTTLGSTFKLLESFEGLLERDVIAADVAVKHQDLLKTFASDIKEVQDLFDTFKAYPVLAKNAAPHSGGCWASTATTCTGRCQAYQLSMCSRELQVLSGASMDQTGGSSL